MKLDRKTRKFLTMAKMHHPKADVDRLYIPRKAGGRGLVQLEITYKTTTIGLNTHLNNKDDNLLKIARDHDSGKKTMSIHHQAEKYGRELSLPEAEVVENEPATDYARRVKLKAKHHALEQLKSKWEEKPLHGQYPKRTKEKDVDQDKTHNWLSTPGLKSETEGFIIAAQDQCIKTNYYRNKILKDGTDPMCRICGKFQETVDHLVSGCPELAKTEYMQRHNKAEIIQCRELCALVSGVFWKNHYSLWPNYASLQSDLTNPLNNFHKIILIKRMIMTTTVLLKY